MSSKDYLRIARVLKPQGVRGELKLEILTDLPESLGSVSAILVENAGGSREEYSVESIALRNNGFAYIKLAGIDDRDAAETLKNVYVCLKRDSIPLPEGRWFIDDLIGCEVFDSDGQSLGKLKDVLQHGAADVYVVAGGAKGFMFPAIKRILQNVDISQKKIILDSQTLSEVAVWDD